MPLACRPDLPQAEILAQARGRILGNPFPCKLCGEKVVGSLIRDHQREKHGIVGHPFRDLITEFRKPGERSLAYLTIHELKDLWMSIRHHGVSTPFLAELLHRNGHESHGLFAEIFSAFLKRLSIDLEILPQPSNLLIVVPRTQARIGSAATPELAITWFIKQWDRGRFSSSIRQEATCPATKSALQALHNTLVPSGGRLSIAQQADGTFTVSVVHARCTNPIHPNLTVEAAWVTAQEILRKPDRIRFKM